MAKAEKGGDKKGKAEEPPRPKTMVEQIDEILAEQIKGTPLENRGLRIVQNDVGVTVWVGLDHYDGIEAVIRSGDKSCCSPGSGDLGETSRTD